MCVCVCVCVCLASVSLLMHISFNNTDIFNTLGKGMNPIILPPAMGK